MPPKAHFDISKLDLNRTLADREEIGKYNPQRFEWQRLDAIVYIDPKEHIIAGYRDEGVDEFWVRGHMPGYPLMPGVLMCESAAQMCSYYVLSQKFADADFIGFGGLDNVRFRGTVHPGDRLVFVAKGLKLNRRQMVFNVQGFVGNTMVFEGDVIGMAMTRKEG
jgi:3-hydroxyacyl-[acyl-carrier-protein] dehydratase